MLRVYYWDVVIFCRLGLHSAPNLGWSGIQKKSRLNVRSVALLILQQALLLTRKS